MLSLLTLPVKAVALWKAARIDQKWWFAALFITNTFGILDFIYIFFVAKKYKVASPVGYGRGNQKDEWSMFYVYLLKSKKTETKYIGCTGDLRKRLLEHNSGKVYYTKNKGPWILIYYEAFINKYDAFNKERQLKNEYTKKRHLLERLPNSLQNY